MWKATLLFTFGCLLFDGAASQGGAESLPFYGFMPQEHIRAKPPVADNGPNDIYDTVPIITRELKNDEFVLYPHHFGFEYGKDPEGKVYEIVSAKDISSNQGGHHHDKKHHHKHGKEHKHQHEHHPEASHHHEEKHEFKPTNTNHEESYGYQSPVPKNGQPSLVLPKENPSSIHPSYPSPPKKFIPNIQPFSTKRGPSKKKSTHPFFSI